ncbi:MAG: hypothetical protein AB9888_17685 [Bacteroidales bacterium]
MRKPSSEPSFFIDSLPEVPGTERRDLLRTVGIDARPHDIFLWLKQLRVAPYSYDFIDNRRRKSPGFIIENLPPLRINTHFLLAFHISEFEEDSFIVCRFCEPVNPPFNLCLQGLYIEYRIAGNDNKTRLWCKVSGYIKRNPASGVFFSAFSLANKIMMTRQLKNIKKYSELASEGKVGSGKLNLCDYFQGSGIHWWIFCRRHGCKGLLN